MIISGIIPAITGNGWFVFDRSGSFSLDESVWASIYLVGGGCDGENGYYNAEKNTYHGGKGGDGGYVFKFGKVVLFKDVEYDISVAENNDKSGTSITINGRVYNCGDMGCSKIIGGLGGIINSNFKFVSPKNGLSGIATPYGTVGSSGGGGAVIYKYINTPFGSGGTGAGNGRENCFDNVSDEIKDEITKQINAQNYGCGGGGDLFCVNSEFEGKGINGRGKCGCVIIVYEPYDEKFPDLTVRYWKPTDAEKNLENVELLRSKYSELLSQNQELKAGIARLENDISERNKDFPDI